MSTRAKNKINWTRKGDPTRHGAMSEKGKVRQKKRWEDNISGWTGFKLGEDLRKAENREE